MGISLHIDLLNHRSITSLLLLRRNTIHYIGNQHVLGNPAVFYSNSSTPHLSYRMSWFGGGGSGGSKSDSNSGSSYQPESSYQDQGFAGQQESFAAPRSAGGTSAESFQQELLMEQQKALIQAVMFKLTETAFKKCVTSPSTSLSSSKNIQSL